jgi:DNA-binding NarL/FixJ family response regulator
MLNELGGTSTTEQPRAPIVVADLSLVPGEQGLRLVRRIRSRFPKLRLVVVGLDDDPHSSRLALEAGASVLLHKSNLATDLSPVIDALAGQPAARRALS